MSAAVEDEVGERLAPAGDPGDVVSLTLQRADERECDVFFVLDDAEPVPCRRA